MVDRLEYDVKSHERQMTLVSVVDDSGLVFEVRQSVILVLLLLIIGDVIVDEVDAGDSFDLVDLILLQLHIE